MSKRLFSINSVADDLSVCRSSVYSLCRRGELELIKVGGKSVITADSVQAYVERQKARPVYGVAKRAV
jgi:excisionase family DNA binding protein